MSDTKVLVLLGSLRAASINRQLVELAIESAPDGVRLKLFDRLGEVPFYNEDLDTDDAPEPVKALRAAAFSADAALVVTPEYNTTMPGVLKNAVDWISRPHHGGALRGKPLAVVGSSHGRHGGAWAHDEARKALGMGAEVNIVEGLTLALASDVFGGKHPRENAEVAAQLRDIVGKLAAEVG